MLRDATVAAAVTATASAAPVKIYSWIHLKIQFVDIGGKLQIYPKIINGHGEVPRTDLLLINEIRHVWHNQLPTCIIGFKKYLAVLEDLGPPHEISLPHLHLPQPVLENTVYKVEDLGGT